MLAREPSQSATRASISPSTATSAHGKLLVSRPSPRLWKAALPDLRSRLDAMRVVAIEAPDDIVLAAILRARFAERAMTPGDDVIEYLVRRIDRSADAAEAVVDRLDALHRPVTRVLARQVLDGGDIAES